MSVIKANIEMNEESVFDRAGCKRRYDAFWGRLDENRRVTVRIAMLIFEFVKNYYDEQKLMSKAADSDVQSAMYRKSLEWAKCAAAQADRFMLIAGVATRTAAFEKLDAIIAWANRNEWPITPLKWQLNPRKTAAELFVEIREAAKMRDRLLITEHSTKKDAR